MAEQNTAVVQVAIQVRPLLKRYVTTTIVLTGISQLTSFNIMVIADVNNHIHGTMIIHHHQP